MTMIYITAKRMSGGGKHRHIAEVEWKDEQTGETGRRSRGEMVDWLKVRGNVARVKDKYSPGYVEVGIVSKKRGKLQFIRTYRDNTKTDNLLELPPIKD